jgi:hypothetical protein
MYLDQLTRLPLAIMQSRLRHQGEQRAAPRGYIRRQLALSDELSDNGRDCAGTPATGRGRQCQVGRRVMPACRCA